jgi:hypothetical protein
VGSGVLSSQSSAVNIGSVSCSHTFDLVHIYKSCLTIIHLPAVAHTVFIAYSPSSSSFVRSAD